MLEDLKPQLGELREKLAQMETSLEVPAKEEKIAELEYKMGEPTFWDDAEQAQKIKSSAEMNGSMWPINTRVNLDETLPYDDAVAFIIKNYNTKLTWFDKWVDGL